MLHPTDNHGSVFVELNVYFCISLVCVYRKRQNVSKWKRIIVAIALLLHAFPTVTMVILCMVAGTEVFPSRSTRENFYRLLQDSLKKKKKPFPDRESFSHTYIPTHAHVKMITF